MKRTGKKRGGPRPRALIIEDDRAIAKLIDFNLSGAGFDPRRVTTGEEALHSVAREPTELIVLDLALPGIDGLTVCRRLKDDAQTRAIPILIVSARGEEEDVIAGLEIGADDYVTKPFNPREVVARVKAALRRRDWDRSEDAGGGAVSVGNLTLDPAGRDVTVAGERVRLRQREFDLLHAFLRHPNVALDRERLLSMVWGQDYYGDSRTIDVHVAWLREKLAAADAKIETVWGIGYKLIPAEEPPAPPAAADGGGAA